MVGQHPSRAPSRQAGFTLIELLISVVLGAFVVGTVLSFTTSSMRNLEHNRSNEEIARSARYVGMALERDLQETGVSLSSTTTFGSLSVRSDTLVILRVPFEPGEAPPHALVPGAGTSNPLPPGGTCGATCVTIDTGGNPLDLAVGDLARMQIGSERRLILVSGVTVTGSQADLVFTSDTTLLGFRAGFAGGIQLDRFATFVQKLRPTIYYADGDVLKRADALLPNGKPAGEEVVWGIRSWDAWLVFTDGDEAEYANPWDSDGSNDYDDLLGVRIKAELAADHPLLRSAPAGVPDPTETFEWKFAPRNLTYERNRIIS